MISGFIDSIMFRLNTFKNIPSLTKALKTDKGQPRNLVVKRWNHLEKVDEAKVAQKKKVEGAPVKFTTSEACVDYKATKNFYSEHPSDVPKSHNAVLALSGMFGFFYLIFLRDDIDNDGGVNLFVPVHETVPSLAIPLLQSAIAENKKFGYNTTKLEKKLAEYMKEPEKYGGGGHKLVEN